MKKTIHLLVMAVLCLNFKATAQPFTEISGRVTSASGKSLPDATVKIKSGTSVATTDKYGNFNINTNANSGILVISFLGHQTKEVAFNVNKTKIINVILQESENALTEVSIVSTGYQNIPKERATGSFVLIDSTMLNRRVSTNILDRLDGLTSGLSFNRSSINGSNNSEISIRGRSTIFGNTNPLIVLDNFPYEGDLNNINPNDIESITLLKDAAASSIWGTRAGNGVIVLTSKKGKKNKKLTIGVSSTLTITGKPDQYYKSQITSSDFIDLEKYLFSKGFYNSTLNNRFSPVSPAVEIFNKRKNKEITSIDSATQINNLKSSDIRSQLDQYFYKPAIYQQYQLNLNGGGNNHQYYLSGGYDKNVENKITDNYDRLTLNARNTYSLFKDKLEITGGLNFITGNTNSLSNPYTPYTPYERLTDDQGNPLAIVGYSTLRLAYTDTAGHGKLLNWQYKPIEELTPNTKYSSIQYKMIAGINYKIIPGLNFELNYQYLHESNNRKIHNDQDRFYTRNLINRYSSILNNQISRVIPLGSILDQSETDIRSKILRLQINYQKQIAPDHMLNAIAGYEGGDFRRNDNSITLYGYNHETQINANNAINPQAYYPYYYQPQSSSQLQTAPTQGTITNITQSYYSNISYSFKNRYILSGSARKDESNLFGVKTNQKGVPLWSAGLAWNLDRESFFKIDWLTSLKLRATYGYNGNVDKTVSGYLTLKNIGLINEWGSNYSQIANPPNPSLRWEKIKTWNLGLDYVVKNQRISGSLDIYQKDAIDLIGNNPIAMQSGVTQFRGNGANLRSKGIDLVINTKNIIGQLQWTSGLLFNYNTDKVSSYKIKQTSNGNTISGNFNNPLEGYPYNAIFSFPSLGLDATGAPQGYLDGAVSKDYTRILATLDPNQLIFHGSASPKYFGSLMNTFTYKDFEFSFNITYKFDYYFRRSGVFNGFGTDYASLTDYEHRWQKPGDEFNTKIPVFNYPQNNSSGTFFQYSEDLVERADHVRLQDIRFSYRLVTRPVANSTFKQLSIFLFAKNAGILWRKNKLNIDPDYSNSDFPLPFSCSLGININL